MTTKGSGINNLAYDSKYLIPKVRTSLDLNYLTEKALNFYGYNGYESDYNLDFEDDEHADYKSRMYYRHERNLLRFTADFQGELIGKKLLWVAGFGFYGSKIASVDIDNLNDGKDEEDKLPSVEDVPGVYEQYVASGIIPESEKDGGNISIIKLGVVYDTRDNEPNPFSGMWSEAFLQASPSFLGSDASYTQFSITNRQYFTLKKDILNFAYRLSYQTKLSGDMPFYMLPFVYYSNKPTRNGLGGSKTLRGIRRNRIVGDGFAYGNFELRWKFLRTVIWNQNLYIALSGFSDAGIVTKKYEFDMPAGAEIADDESLHLSYGLGLHFALNQNFIIAVDYGMAANKQDGNTGLYIGLNFLY
jgi:outer membrane protein assembly factor BamA